LPTFRENFMQIHSDVFAQLLTDRHTDNDENITSLVEVITSLDSGGILISSCWVQFIH